MLNEDETGTPLDPAWPGLARELARMNLSLNFYTQWYWKIDLYNLMHFLGLRADPHAQYEIRAYAEAMLGTMQRWVPLAYAAFVEYRMNAASISATGLKVIQRMLAGELVEQKDSGLSPREWRELMAVLGR
jgi:thymidylate synthase (FAD)